MKNPPAIDLKVSVLKFALQSGANCNSPWPHQVGSPFLDAPFPSFPTTHRPAAPQAYALPPQESWNYRDFSQDRGAIPVCESFVCWDHLWRPTLHSRLQRPLRIALLLFLRHCSNRILSLCKSLLHAARKCPPKLVTSARLLCSCWRYNSAELTSSSWSPQPTYNDKRTDTGWYNNCGAWVVNVIETHFLSAVGFPGSMQNMWLRSSAARPPRHPNFSRSCRTPVPTLQV